MADWHITDCGRWADSAVRNLPRGQARWSGIPRRAYSLHVEAKGRPHLLATVRRRGVKQWIARVEGFEWTITPDHPVARFQSIPGTRPMTHTPIKPFDSRSAAQEEIERIVAAMPVGGGDDGTPD